MTETSWERGLRRIRRGEERERARRNVLEMEVETEQITPDTSLLREGYEEYAEIDREEAAEWDARPEGWIDGAALRERVRQKRDESGRAHTYCQDEVLGWIDEAMGR